MNAKTKILVVGAFDQSGKQYTYATSFYHALQRLGFTVATFNYRTSFIPLVPRGLVSAKFLAPANQTLCNKALIRQLTQFKPDLIFCIKAESLTPQTLRSIKQSNPCKIINFYPDNPFAVWNGNSNADVLASLPLYDHFLSWSETLMPALYAAGCNHVSFFPFAFDETIFTQASTLTADEEQRYSSDVCFIGTWEAKREQWLTALIEALPQLNLAIWGNEWINHTKNQKLRSCIRGNALYGQAMIKTMQASKIVLNFIRQQNTTAHNMRTLEALAAGTFLLTEYTYQQAHILCTEGIHLACFTTTQDLINQINHYLNNKEQRQTIARQGNVHVQQYALTKQLQQKLCQIVPHADKEQAHEN